jgi:dTDP-N-acetylfucosamine:lipid II N-acetylfucosaminyltransferase
MQSLHLVGNELKFIIPQVRYFSEVDMGCKNLFLFVIGERHELYQTIKKLPNAIIVNTTNLEKLPKLLSLPLKYMLTWFNLAFYSNMASKIYLHGIFDIKIILFYGLFRKYDHKLCWMIWGGGDVYPEGFIKKFSLLKYFDKRLKNNIPNYLTFIQSDFLQCQKSYNSKATHTNFLMYESNCISDSKKICEKKREKTSLLKILLGNSADPANCHIDALHWLACNSSAIQEIIIPFSYGSKPWRPNYRNEICAKIPSRLQSRVTFLDDYMSYDKYLNLLNTVDVAVMPHHRQQGMGNLIQLANKKSTIYLNQNNNAYSYFAAIGVQVNKIGMPLELLQDSILIDNLSAIRKLHSLTTYETQIRNIFL